MSVSPILLNWRAAPEFKAPSPAAFRKIAQNAIRAVFPAPMPVNRQVSFAFLSPEEMAETNQLFLGHTGETDVISFDYSADMTDPVPTDLDEPEVAIEIIVCPSVAYSQSKKRNIPYSRELVLYLLHGLLHMVGYDDLQPELKRKMRTAERRAMRRFSQEINPDTCFPDRKAFI